MKKLIITTCITSAAISTAVCFAVTSQNDLKNLNALEMANIEAITKSESPNLAKGYKLTNCHANNTDEITGQKCKLANYWDECYYTQAWGNCKEKDDENEK